MEGDFGQGPRAACKLKIERTLPRDYVPTPFQCNDISCATSSKKSTKAWTAPATDLGT